MVDVLKIFNASISCTRTSTILYVNIFQDRIYRILFYYRYVQDDLIVLRVHFLARFSYHLVFGRKEDCIDITTIILGFHTLDSRMS